MFKTDRMLPWLPAQASTDSTSTSIQSGPRRHRDDAAVVTLRDPSRCHAVVAPLHYESGYAYPLIIWLHGGGGDERQLHEIMPHVSLRNFVAAAPRGTASATPLEDESVDSGYTWRQSEDHIFLAEQRVLNCVANAADRYHVHPQRVFLAGYLAGGTMALRIALANPFRFAGAISICGPFPDGNSPLGRVNRARQMPVLLAAGREGRFYSERRMAADLRLLHSAGFSTTLRLYPEGDELTTVMLEDVNRWVMEQVCPSGAVREPVESDPRY